MRFSIQTLMLILPVVYSAALPQEASTECYDKCLSTADCPKTWPESCKCLNAYKTKCAAACPKEEIVPVLDVCDKEENVKCFEECMSGWACIQVWPQSCYCNNGNIKTCSTKCETTPVYQDCGDGSV